jgi:hypothetical protein
MSAARHSQNPRNPFHAGEPLRGFHGSHICYGLPVCSPPCTDPTSFPAVGDFYVQASGSSVTLPAAGYDYSSGWTPLLAGLAPAGTTASLAARHLGATRCRTTGVQSTDKAITDASSRLILRNDALRLARPHSLPMASRTTFMPASIAAGLGVGRDLRRPLIAAIAVGTQVTPRPPHRSVRARLRHTAPTLGGDGKANTWPWVKDLGLREKVIGQSLHPLP